MQTRRHSSHTAAGSKRRGTAQMELTLFLPLYAATLMLLFTVFSFARTRSAVAVESRHDAWIKRVRVGTETDELPTDAGAAARSIGRILNGSLNPALGLVTATHQQQASLYLKTLNLATDLQQEHAVLTDSWDYRSLPFPDAGSHPRLTLDRRILAFGRIDPGMFSTLAGGLSIFGSQAASQSGALDAQRQAAIQQFRKAAAELREQIQTLQNQVDDLKDQLARVQNAVPPDLLQIARITNQIREASNALSRRRHELRNLTDANRHLAGL